jgi:hypothetical protein
MNGITSNIIPVEEIVLNDYEFAKRLNIKKGFASEEIDYNLERLKAVVNCKYAQTRAFVEHFDDDWLNCGFGMFKSEKLVKNLKNCRETFVFAVTLGIGVDRLLNKLSALSVTDYFITDALASAMAEAAVDEAEKRIKGEVNCRPRFSPGFGDFSIELQPKIIDLLNGQRLLGISVGKSLLMTPMKSVTAIMGILE